MADEGTYTTEVLGATSEGLILEKNRGKWTYVMSASEKYNFAHVLKILDERVREKAEPLAFATFERVNGKLKLRDVEFVR